MLIGKRMYMPNYRDVRDVGGVEGSGGWEGGGKGMYFGDFEVGSAHLDLKGVRVDVGLCWRWERVD